MSSFQVPLPSFPVVSPYSTTANSTADDGVVAAAAHINHQMQQIIHDSSVAEKSQSCAQTIPNCELMKLGPLVTSVGYKKPSNRDYRDSLAVLKKADNNEGGEASEATDWLQMMKTTSCVNNNRQSFHQHSLHHLHHHDRPLLPLQLQQISTSSTISTRSGSRQEMVEMAPATTVPTATTATTASLINTTTSTRTMRRASIRMSFFDDGHDDEILLAKRLRGLLYNPDYVERPQRAHQPTGGRIVFRSSQSNNNSLQYLQTFESSQQNNQLQESLTASLPSLISGINTICKSATAATTATPATTAAAADNGATSPTSPRASTLLLSSDVVEWLSYKVVKDDGDSMLMDSSKRGVPGGSRAVPGSVPSGVPGDQDVLDVQNNGTDNVKDKDDDYADYAACLLNTLPQSTQSSICIMGESPPATTMQQPQQQIQQMMLMSMDFLVMAQTQQVWDNYQTNHDYMYPATDTTVTAVLFKDMTEDNTASTTAIGFRPASPASPPASMNCEKCSCCVKVNTVVINAATAAAASSSSQITKLTAVAASSSAATPPLPATTATIALPNITVPTVPPDDAVPLLVPYAPPIITSTITTAVTADVRNYDENNIVMTTAAGVPGGGCNTCCRTCTTACTGLTGCHLLPDDPIVTTQAASADDTDDVSNNCTAGRPPAIMTVPTVSSTGPSTTVLAAAAADYMKIQQASSFSSCLNPFVLSSPPPPFHSSSVSLLAHNNSGKCRPSRRHSSIMLSSYLDSNCISGFRTAGPLAGPQQLLSNNTTATTATNAQNGIVIPAIMPATRRRRVSTAATAVGTCSQSSLRLLTDAGLASSTRNNSYYYRERRISSGLIMPPQFSSHLNHMPAIPVGATRTSSCTAGRLGLHMSCMAVDHHFESTITSTTGGDISGDISGDVASVVDVFHNRSRYDDSLPVIMDCNRLSRVLSRILAEDLDDFYNASTCDYENMDLLLLPPSSSSIKTTATTTTAATIAATAATTATDLLIVEGQCADDCQLVPLAGPVEPAHNLKSFKRGATASMKTATAGHEVYEDYYEDGLLVAAALTGRSHQLCLMHNNAGQQQVRQQAAGEYGDNGECPASNPSSAQRQLLIPKPSHITTTQSRGCRAGWRANKLGLRQSSGSQQSSQRLFGKRMKSGQLGQQQPAATAIKSGTVGLLGLQPPALPATASSYDLRPSATTSSLLAANSTDSMSSSAARAAVAAGGMGTVSTVRLVRQAAFSSFSAMGRLIWQQSSQSRRRLLTIDNGPPVGPVIGSAASRSLAAAAAAPNTTNTTAATPTNLLATTSAQILKQHQQPAPAADDDSSRPDDNVLPLCHHVVEETDDIAVVTVVETQLSGMSGLFLDGYNMNDAGNNIIDEVNINEAGFINNVSAVSKTAFCTAVSKLQTYAAITNWLLWQLNALEGSAEPVDPFDNDDGLCQQLKALMNDLDDSLVSFLCHMGVKEEGALDIVSDNTSVNKKEAAAYLDPYQTIAVQELVNWRSSIIRLYVKAITRAANHEDQVVEYDYSDDLEYLEFHRNGGQAALSADLMPTNLATLAAPTDAPDAAQVNSSSPSSYSSCFAGLTVASALSEELRQKLLERFQSHLRINACQLWALFHVLDPKPTREDKALLATYTGKTAKQITDWYTNWRARHWRPGMTVFVSKHPSNPTMDADEC